VISRTLTLPVVSARPQQSVALQPAALSEFPREFNAPRQLGGPYRLM
jgi:hypothetical protein